jgi:hypothetical protein
MKNNKIIKDQPTLDDILKAYPITNDKWDLSRTGLRSYLFSHKDKFKNYEIPDDPWGREFKQFPVMDGQGIMYKTTVEGHSVFCKLYDK